MPGAPITCFGLAFKPDVADLRESPALEIARGLAAEFPGRVVAVEPQNQTAALMVVLAVAQVKMQLPIGQVARQLMDRAIEAVLLLMLPIQTVAVEVVRVMLVVMLLTNPTVLLWVWLAVTVLHTIYLER
jgi:UDP-glucose 6-dehydrogenase